MRHKHTVIGIYIQVCGNKKNWIQKLVYGLVHVSNLCLKCYREVRLAVIILGSRVFCVGVDINSSNTMFMIIWLASSYQKFDIVHWVWLLVCTKHQWSRHRVQRSEHKSTGWSGMFGWRKVSVRLWELSGFPSASIFLHPDIIIHNTIYVLYIHECCIWKDVQSVSLNLYPVLFNHYLNKLGAPVCC